MRVHATDFFPSPRSSEYSSLSLPSSFGQCVRDKQLTVLDVTLRVKVKRRKKQQRARYDAAHNQEQHSGN